MFAKPTTLFALLAVATRVLATPPACLIAAVNTQPNPATLSAVCSGNNATAVESYICKNCTADTVQLAMSGFASVCAGAGVTIKNTTSCSATSSSSSSSGTASMTSSGAILATGSSGAILTGGASSGFATATANGTVSSAHSAPTATQSSSGGSGSGTSGSGSGSNGASGTSSGSSASASAKPYTGAAARLGMDLVGLAALGAFGAMLAL
ncbi:hypothetical protein LTR78_009579 [Recurvomyces mirabilis]|uniref:Uncharacterized protein n=1 Tax=Recurvomyces mirabilis TaxID=574656 RepID=A0AAE0TP44_9PEZI|nr:hypothetical protein LTR78_009579 [Recurvomyces mirabilis]KAK5156578.1 hypothetical protein LTS14_004790 [Recurvomyces mirabilis]